MCTLILCVFLNWLTRQSLPQTHFPAPQHFTFLISVGIVWCVHLSLLFSSLLLSLLPSFLHCFFPSFLHFFLPSFVPLFIHSFLCCFLLSFLPPSIPPSFFLFFVNLVLAMRNENWKCLGKDWKKNIGKCQ
jgi:hypothetical protein